MHRPQPPVLPSANSESLPVRGYQWPRFRRLANRRCCCWHCCCSVVVCTCRASDAVVELTRPLTSETRPGSLQRLGKEREHPFLGILAGFGVGGDGDTLAWMHAVGNLRADMLAHDA